MTEDSSLLAAELLKQIEGGNYALAAVTAVLLLTLASKRWGSRLIPWLGTRTGVISTAVLGSVAGALFTALTAHGVEGLTLSLVLKVVVEAVLVAGVALLPSPMAKAEAKGQEAAAKVVDLSDALAELNRPRYMGSAQLEAEKGEKR